MEEEIDSDFNASYEEDNPSETSSVSINASALEFLDETVDSNITDDDPSCLDVSFESSVVSTPTKRVTRSSSRNASFSQDEATTSTPQKQPKEKGKRSNTKKGKNDNTNKGKTDNAKKGKNDENNNDGFKKPKAPPVYFAKCPRCGQGLKTFVTFTNHTKAHTWKDMASKIPSEPEIRGHCEEKAVEILQQMVKEEHGGLWGVQFKETCTAILNKVSTPQWKLFLNKVSDIVVGGVTGVNIQKKTLLFASTSLNHLITHINLSLNDKDTRDELAEKLLQVQVCVVQVLYPLLFNFVRKLGNAALARIFNLMSERDPASKLGAKRSKDDFTRLKSQRVVHYISGSCMRQMIRHAYNHPHSAKLQRRKMCILRRFGTIGEPTGAQLSSKAYWTSIINRKSLFFVKGDVLPFFVDVANKLQTMELPNGSLNHDLVMDEISRSPYFLQKWSNIIDSDLDDDESFDLMVKVVRALTNTFSRGILNRRMNMKSKKGKNNKSTLSISHRARLL